MNIWFALGLLIGALLAWSMVRTFRGARRGEQRILELLAASAAPMYGLDLVERSGGLLKRGTVYVLLARLEERGLVESIDYGLAGRRMYTLARVPPIEMSA